MRPTQAGPWAYALAWLPVAGGNSVMPPWMVHQFPEAGQLVRRLRDTACTSPDCGSCRERHDADRELQGWFRFPSYRSELADANGQPLQRAAVEATMAGQNVLAIFPTGTGKSVCYQVLALSRYGKTGDLTVVISPLVALMSDQVTGMEARGIGCATAINGLLSMPERSDSLDRVRLGDAGILLIAPEQLRSPMVRRALAHHRTLGAGRGPLPVALGPRLSVRLPLRGTVHQGKLRGRPGPAGALPHGHRQARRDLRNHGLLQERVEHGDAGVRRRRPAN